MIMAVKPSDFTQKILRDAEDLDQLNIFTRDQSASRLCIDDKGHLWTQNIDVNIVVKVLQYLERLCYEMSFSSEDEKVDFLVNNIQLLLKEVVHVSALNGTLTQQLQDLSENFGKDSLKKEHELMKSSQLKVKEILSNPTLSTAEKSLALDQLQLISDLSLSFLSARVSLVMATRALAEVTMEAPVEQVVPAKVDPIQNVAVDTPSLVEVRVEALAQPIITIKSSKPQTHYFKEIATLTKQLFTSAPDPVGMLRVKLDKMVLNPTAENKEKLKGMLVGTQKYIQMTESVFKKEMAQSFYWEMTMKIGQMEGVSEYFESREHAAITEPAVDESIFYDVEL